LIVWNKLCLDKKLFWNHFLKRDASTIYERNSEMLNKFKNFGWYWSPEGGAGGSGDAGDQTDPGNPGDQDETQTPTFESWLEEQDETVQGLYESHTQGLRTALDTERSNRKKLEKQLRELAAKAEKGSENETQLNQMADRLAETERQNTFFDAAHAAGVRNLKLAWLAASEAGLVRKDGQADFAALKEQFPELFEAGPPRPSGNPGDGTRTPPAGNDDFSNAIRRAAGRQV
jgi:hypothetical protein